MLARVKKNQFLADRLTTNTHHGSYFSDFQAMLLSPETKQLYVQVQNIKRKLKLNVQLNLGPERRLILQLVRITNSVGVFSVECGLAAVFVTLLTVTRPLFTLNTALHSVLLIISTLHCTLLGVNLAGWSMMHGTRGHLLLGHTEIFNKMKLCVSKNSILLVFLITATMNQLLITLFHFPTYFCCFISKKYHSCQSNKVKQRRIKIFLFQLCWSSLPTGLAVSQINVHISAILQFVISTPHHRYQL